MNESDIVIRPYRSSDEQDIINICSITGYTPYPSFNDSYLFSLKWCLYYLWYEPENCFVAEDVDSKKAAGYIIAAKDSVVMRKRYNDKMIPLIRRHILRKNWFAPLRYKKNIKLFAHSESYTGKELEIAVQYPSHLHINLLPGYQGKRLGDKLVTRLEEQLKSNGSSGIHLGVAENNTGAVRFYKRQGFNEVFCQGFNAVKVLFFAKDLTGGK